MAKQKRDAAATQSKIIQNAMELFAKKGFDGVSVDEVAAASAINKAMIFYYFKNKAGLYEAVMRGVLDDIYEEIVEADKCCQNTLGELKAFIATYASFAKRYPDFPALLLRELSDSGAHLPELMFESMKKLFVLLSDILDKGVKEGLFKDVIPMIVHFMIIGTMNLYMTTEPLRKRAEDEDGLDTCSSCDIEEISEYIYRKILLMLEVDDEKNVCRS